MVGTRQDNHFILDGAAKENGRSACSLARCRLQVCRQFRSFFWIAAQQCDRVSARDQPSADTASHVACSNDSNVHRLPPSFFASSCLDLPPASTKGKRQRSLAKKPFLLLRPYASVQLWRCRSSQRPTSGRGDAWAHRREYCR